MHGTAEFDDGGYVQYLGGFIQCPECDGEAELVIWGEGYDADFKCLEDDCDAHDGIR